MRWKGLLACAALAACSACNYTSSTSLPAHVQTVRVRIFENRTAYAGLESELASHLGRAFQVDGTLRLVNSGADAVLDGHVTAVRRSVLQEDALDDVTTLSVVVVARIRLVDASSGHDILPETTVTSADTESGRGVFRLTRGETELEARGGAVAELARNIVRRVVEVW